MSTPPHSFRPHTDAADRVSPNTKLIPGILFPGTTSPRPRPPPNLPRVHDVSHWPHSKPLGPSGPGRQIPSTVHSVKERTFSFRPQPPTKFPTRSQPSRLERVPNRVLRGWRVPTCAIVVPHRLSKCSPCSPEGPGGGAPYCTMAVSRWSLGLGTSFARAPRTGPSAWWQYLIQIIGSSVDQSPSLANLRPQAGEFPKPSWPKFFVGLRFCWQDFGRGGWVRVLKRFFGLVLVMNREVFWSCWETAARWVIWPLVGGSRWIELCEGDILGSVSDWVWWWMFFGLNSTWTLSSLRCRRQWRWELVKQVSWEQSVMGCDPRGGSFGRDSTSDDFEAWESEVFFGGGGLLWLICEVF